MSDNPFSVFWLRIDLMLGEDDAHYFLVASGGSEKRGWVEIEGASQYFPTSSRTDLLMEIVTLVKAYMNVTEGKEVLEDVRRLTGKNRVSSLPQSDETAARDR